MDAVTTPRRRVRACFLAGPAAALSAAALSVALTGCDAARPAAASTPAAASSAAVAPADATTAATPTPALADLAQRVGAAVAAATSVHVDATGAGLPIVGAGGPVSGTVALTAGRPTAADLHAGSASLRWVDGVGYLSRPGADPARPWTRLDPGSSDPVVATLGRALAGLTQGTAAPDLTALIGAASGLRPLGASTVDGTPVTGWSLEVDPAALAAALGTPGAGGSASRGPVTVTAYLDGSDRPVRVQADPPAGAVTVDLSAWDAPVDITAPPASQVR